MVFSSIPFLYYFLPCVIISYRLTPKKYWNFVFLVFSLFFYFYGEPKYSLLMAGAILSAYLHAILIDKGIKYRKAALISAVALPLAALAYFKYSDFILENINIAFGLNIPLPRVKLPIGISFYTFQSLSYVIDVYRGDTKAQKSLIGLGLYVSMFPQLIAGPVVRYVDIENSLPPHKSSADEYYSGIRRLIIGLSKKAILANSLGLACKAFTLSQDKTTLFYWIYTVSYALQIYFDFSGYSDMAIGMGLMFGFRFLENFNYPYTALSATDFWRRWHISLSSWFRDYVYIPLKGSRGTRLMWVRNILVVWLLTGLWHGAAWNFIVWGLYFGAFIIMEKLFILAALEKCPNIIKRIYAFLVISFSWAIFASDSLPSALESVKAMMFVGAPLIGKEDVYSLRSFFVLICISILASTPLFSRLIGKLRQNPKLNGVLGALEAICLALLLIISTAYIVDGSFNPFLYFRF